MIANNLAKDCECFRLILISVQEKKDHARMMQNKQLEPALLTHEGRSYDALFNYTPNYTKFYGNSWMMLAFDYALNAGDRIVFFLDDWA